nr:sensor histidine kinase [arsenite-oxidising bacterium NT-25]
MLLKHRRNTWSVATASTTVIAGMLSALVVVLSIWLWASHEAAERRAEERAMAAAKIVATNARWINSLAWQALQRIDDSLGPATEIQDYQQVRDINEAVRNLPGEVQAYVVDHTGRTAYSTDPNIQQIDITDREYFKALAQGEKRYVSSLLVSRLNGEQIFVFSRRLEREGRFAGAAIVSFNVDLLEEVWEAVNLGGNSTVNMIRSDGQLVARYPKAPNPVDMSNYVLFTDYLHKSPSGTYLATSSPVDGAKRMVGYTIVEGTSFVAVGTADYRLAMSRFWQDVVVASLIILAAGIGSAAAGAWIRHLLKRDAETAGRLVAALEENQLLLREVHHRVKNNLQSVQAVIKMQQLPPQVQQSLASRIGAMMTVHEQIYGHDQFGRIPVAQLLPALVQTIVKAHDAAVQTDYDIDDLTVSGDQATSLALLVNELVTNSIKYGIANGRGIIRIQLKSLPNGRARLVVADNGPGFDASDVKQGMGSRLIRGVVSQLNGSFDYSVDGGTSFSTEIQLGDPVHEPSAARDEQR